VSQLWSKFFFTYNMSIIAEPVHFCAALAPIQEHCLCLLDSVDSKFYYFYNGTLYILYPKNCKSRNRNSEKSHIVMILECCFEITGTDHGIMFCSLIYSLFRIIKGTKWHTNGNFTENGFLKCSRNKKMFIEYKVCFYINCNVWS
jgi:hypothetical protein